MFRWILCFPKRVSLRIARSRLRRNRIFCFFLLWALFYAESVVIMFFYPRLPLRCKGPVLNSALVAHQGTGLETIKVVLIFLTAVLILMLLNGISR
jgi:hypothetical protein